MLGAALYREMVRTIPGVQSRRKFLEAAFGPVREREPAGYISAVLLCRDRSVLTNTKKGTPGARMPWMLGHRHCVSHYQAD